MPINYNRTEYSEQGTRSHLILTCVNYTHSILDYLQPPPTPPQHIRRSITINHNLLEYKMLHNNRNRENDIFIVMRILIGWKVCLVVACPLRMHWVDGVTRGHNFLLDAHASADNPKLPLGLWESIFRPSG